MRRNLKYLNLYRDFSLEKLIFILLFLFLVSCDAGTDSGPVGPSNSNNALITVTPASITLAKNDTVTFSATGGTTPFSWSVDDTSLAGIGSTTGTFTAGNSSTSGGNMVTVTATDSNGSTGTATVTISDKTLTIIPETAQVGKTLTQEFTVTGATDPTFWSVGSTNIGSIDTDTGIFTANVTAGSTTVTVLDADGDSASGTVTVIANTIIVLPVSAGPFTAGTQAFTATTNGVAGTYIWTVSGESGNFEGAAVTVSATATVGTTLTFTQPSSDEGAQSLTITATDGNGDTGTATLTLTAADG